MPTSSIDLDLDVDDLGLIETSDALVSLRTMLTRAQARQFQVAAHWASLHDPEFVETALDWLPGERGRRRARQVADGCPDVDLFAGAELGVLLGMSSWSGQDLTADAVACRHRHPLLWSEIEAGTVPVWLARKAVKRCVAANLTREQARWVDAETTPVVVSLGPKRFLQLVDARIIEADPEAAALRAKAAAERRFVSAGPRDEHGMRVLIARAHAGDIACVEAVLDRLAIQLGDDGDPDSFEARRATALRILANPARALAMLTSAAVVASDPGREPSTLGQQDLIDRAARDSLFDDAEPDLGDGPDDHRGGSLIPSGAEISLLAEALARFDAGRLDPLCVFHVHLSAESLRDGEGLARDEVNGPALLSSVRDWLIPPYSPGLTGCNVSVRPVIDPDELPQVDRYEIPSRMADYLAAHLAYETFPYGTLRARRCDLDHGVAYAEGGSTSLGNLSPLGRFHHRLKTHGGWQVERQDDGSHLWRTPTGHRLRVDQTGTHYLGHPDC